MTSFRLTRLIEKKRNGFVLSAEEIQYFIETVVRSERQVLNPRIEIADPCQVGAMLMALYLKGMNDDETNTLTCTMTSTGSVFSWPAEWRHLVVDKHSTGGVGDKVSLVLAPVLAAVGLKVPMISGRSLGHTGGTLDKLESIPGFRVELTKEEVAKQIELVGCCIIGQSADIVPADRVLYRCRNLTATVDCASLVIASIVSKKLAEGVSALVYDVKFGKGSIFRSEEEALEMAKHLVLASREVKCSALLTSMDSPLGNQIGNSLEVLEALKCLQNKGPNDVLELVEELGGELLLLTDNASNKEDATLKITQVLRDGRALRKFHEMLCHQGVSGELACNLCYGDAKSVLPRANSITDVIYSGPTGYITELNASVLANIWKEEVLSSSDLNFTSGFTIRKHIGDKIHSGDVWVRAHHEACQLTEQQLKYLNGALSVDFDAKASRKRVHKVISFNNNVLKISERLDR